MKNLEIVKEELMKAAAKRGYGFIDDKELEYTAEDYAEGSFDNMTIETLVGHLIEGTEKGEYISLERI